MPAPTNTSATTAIDIASLPFSTTQDAHDGGITYPLWYKHTAGAGEVVISIFGFGDLVTYRPRVRVYTGPASAPVGYPTTGQINARNKCVQIPVTVGETYYFQFDPFSGNPSPAILILEAKLAPNDQAPIGSIAINDDFENHPLALLSHTVDNIVKRFIFPFPNGSNGDVLDAGVMAFDDNSVAFSSGLKIYDAAFTLIATLGDATLDVVWIRTCRGLNKFFVGFGSTDPTVKRVTSAGVIDATYTLTGVGIVNAGSANNAGTILYNCRSASGEVIRRWDLPGAAALSDLVAGVVGYLPIQILVMSDDTILVTYRTPSSSDYFIRRYDSTGATLNTYPIGAISGSAKIAAAVDDPNSFWIWLQDVTAIGTSTFRNIKISDGSTLSEIDHVMFSRGTYQPAETATPIGFFGHSVTCPFLIIRVAVPDTPTTGTIIVNKITVPDADDPTVFDITAGGGLVPGTYTLIGGGSQTHSSVAVGSGYSIVETPNGDYVTTYAVSNGSPNTNISVGAGETVTVTITNTKKGQIIVGKVTDPDAGDHEFNFEAAGGLSPTSFILEKDEEQIYDDLNPGSGYSVIELPDPLWSPTYLVSNGSPNTNILVEAGKATTVIVLNQLRSPFSGIAVMNPTPSSSSEPDKKNDTFIDHDGTFLDVKIPNPFIITGLIQDL